MFDGNSGGAGPGGYAMQNYRWVDTSLGMGVYVCMPACVVGVGVGVGVGMGVGVGVQLNCPKKCIGWMMGVEVGRWVGERQCMHWDVVHEGLARTVYIICTPYMTVRHIRCVYMVLADPIIFGISPGQRYCLHTVCTYGCVQPWKHVILARRGCCVMVSYSK